MTHATGNGAVTRGRQYFAATTTTISCSVLSGQFSRDVDGTRDEHDGSGEEARQDHDPSRQTCDPASARALQDDPSSGPLGITALDIESR